MMAQVEKAAIISDCNMYRYRLSRDWGDMFMDTKRCAFVMLNPSTADDETDDPTIRRCISFAMREGCNGFDVYNLFALRATDPKMLQKVSDPVGPDNDSWIRMGTTEDYAFWILAWGAHGGYMNRHSDVAGILFSQTTYCLGLTKEGHPKHPLYISGDAPLISFDTNKAWSSRP